MGALGLRDLLPRRQLEEARLVLPPGRHRIPKEPRGSQRMRPSIASTASGVDGLLSAAYMSAPPIAAATAEVAG